MAEASGQASGSSPEKTPPGVGPELEDEDWLLACTVKWIRKQRFQADKERKQREREWKQASAASSERASATTQATRAKVKREACEKREHLFEERRQEEERLRSLWSQQAERAQWPEHTSARSSTPQRAPSRPVAEEPEADSTLPSRCSSIAPPPGTLDKKPSSGSDWTTWLASEQQVPNKSDGMISALASAAASAPPAPEKPLRTISDQAWEGVQQHHVKKILGGISLGVMRSTRIAQNKLDADDTADLLQQRGYTLPLAKIESLGEGTYGSVFRVQRASDQQLLVVKRQIMGTLSKQTIPWLREVSLLNEFLGAPHILQLQEAFMACPAHGEPEVWMVLEHFPHNLLGALRFCQKEDAARVVVFQILKGLKILHAADIVHRDLKPENVLIDIGSVTEPAEVNQNILSSWRVSICDLGLARSVSNFPDSAGDSHDGRPLSPRVVTSSYRVPEMFHGADTRKMTKDEIKSMDAFSLAMIWSELLTQRQILKYDDGHDNDELLRIAEILQVVDRPSWQELVDLAFRSHVKQVFTCLTDSLSAAALPGAESRRRDYLEAQRPRRAVFWRHIFAREYGGIREELRRSVGELANSRAPELIESAACFSYRRRAGAVGRLLDDPYFEELLKAHPLPAEQRWRLPAPTSDIKDELKNEIDEQETWFPRRPSEPVSPEHVEDCVSAGLRKARSVLKQAGTPGGQRDEAKGFFGDE